MIACTAVTFGYNRKPLISEVDFSIPSGGIAALQGSNGSGKSTLVALMAGLLRPQAGAIRILGVDPSRGGPDLRRRLGVVPDGLGLFAELSIEEQLQLTGRIFGIPPEEVRARSEDLIAYLELGHARWTPARIASQGTRKKLALALALLPDPDVLLLDEPLEGVDSEGCRRIEALFLALAARDRTILFSTHDEGALERLSPRILRIDREGHVLSVPPDPAGYGPPKTAPLPQVPGWLGSSSS